MTSGRTAPPLPPPQPPALAARAVSEAARAAAQAWTQPMDPAESGRAASQLHSVLRDLGIATSGLARFQTTGRPADPAPLQFSRLVAAGAQRLLEAWESLDGVIAAEGLAAVPDPDEPGAVLCRAARTTITAWRQPAGTSTDRYTTMERLVTALGFLTTAARNLAAYAPRQRTIELLAVGVGLAEAAVCIRRAVQAPSNGAAPRPRDGYMADGGRA